MATAYVVLELSGDTVKLLINAVTLTFDHLTLNECIDCHVLKLCAKIERNRSMGARVKGLKIDNLGAVRHLGFQDTWISTIAGPSGTSNEPTYQI